MIAHAPWWGRLAAGAQFAGRCAGACLSVLLAGCAVVHPGSTLAPQGVPVLIERFSLAGRLSVRVGDQLDSVRLEWVRDGRRESISFFSPFGAQLAAVSATTEGATLIRGGVVERAESVSALTESAIGVAISTDLLTRWVQGFEVESDATSVGDDRASRWTIRAENLRAVEGVAGGRVASRMSATSGETTIRLVVDSFAPTFASLPVPSR